MTMETQGVCELCGEPMPPGEEMFKFHGYSGPCPKPPLPKTQGVFRKRPVEVKAMQWTGDYPAMEAYFGGGFDDYAYTIDDDSLIVRADGGSIRAEVGAWITYESGSYNVFGQNEFDDAYEFVRPE